MAAVPSRGRAARVERSEDTGAEATRDLYERFAGQIFGYCLHQLGSREEAEDAVQTTFMNALRGLRRGVVPELEGAWLFKIAHNVCLSRRRSSRRRSRVEAPNNLEVIQEIVPARGERPSEELIRLEDALAGMPETQRRAILLREWQGLSYREIASELDVTQSAVETLIFRARRSLAAGLEARPGARTWGTRARHGLDAGGLIATLKALLSSGVAVKVAVSAVAVVTTTAVAVTGSPHRRATSSHAVPPARASAPRSPKPRAAVVSAPIAPAAHGTRPVSHAAPVARPRPPRRNAAHVKRSAAEPVHPAPVASVPPPPPAVAAPAPAVTDTPAKRFDTLPPVADNGPGGGSDTGGGPPVGDQTGGG